MLPEAMLPDEVCGTTAWLVPDPDPKIDCVLANLKGESDWRSGTLGDLELLFPLVASRFESASLESNLSNSGRSADASAEFGWSLPIGFEPVSGYLVGLAVPVTESAAGVVMILAGGDSPV